MTYTEEFKEFWQKYPGRYHEAGRKKAGGGVEHYFKVGKREAMAEWHKLSDHEKKQAMYAVRFLRQGKFVKDAFRWLKLGRFEDIDMPEEKVSYPANVVPMMKPVPQGDNRSTSDKVNEQIKKLVK